MAQPYLSIIIPTYHEAERLPRTLVAMDKALARAEYSYEILVVDNASRDGTAEIVKHFMHMVNHVKLIEVDEPGGKGATVRAGMREASGAIRLFVDADNAVPVDQFDQMMPFFKDGYDVVIGSRRVRGAQCDAAEGWFRRFSSVALNVPVQLFLLPGMADTQCGFKAFTADAAEKIFSMSMVDGWAFDVELLSLAVRAGLRIKQVPVRWSHDPRSHVRMSAGFDFLRDSIKIRWRLWRKEYPLPRLDTSPHLR